MEPLFLERQLVTSWCFTPSSTSLFPCQSSSSIHLYSKVLRRPPSAWWLTHAALENLPWSLLWLQPSQQLNSFNRQFVRLSCRLTQLSKNYSSEFWSTLWFQPLALPFVFTWAASTTWLSRQSKTSNVQRHLKKPKRSRKFNNSWAWETARQILPLWRRKIYCKLYRKTKGANQTLVQW